MIQGMLEIAQPKMLPESHAEGIKPHPNDAALEEPHKTPPRKSEWLTFARVCGESLMKLRHHSSPRSAAGRKWRCMRALDA